MEAKTSSHTSLQLKVFPGTLCSHSTHGNLTQANVGNVNNIHHIRCLQLLRMKQDKLKHLQDEVASLELEIVALLSFMNSSPKDNVLNKKNPANGDTVWGMPFIVDCETAITRSSLESAQLLNMPLDPKSPPHNSDGNQQIVLMENLGDKQNNNLIQSSDGTHYQRNALEVVSEPTCCSKKSHVDNSESLGALYHNLHNTSADGQTDALHSLHGSSSSPGTCIVTTSAASILKIQMLMETPQRHTHPSPVPTLVQKNI